MKSILLTLVLAGGLSVVAMAETPEPPAYPDTVSIDGLSHWFAPVAFSHADHVDMADDCSACHHDQAPDEIEACDECHQVAYDPTDPDTPDLKMAFHLRCVGCHQSEEASLGCVDCHERRALPAGPELGDAAVR